MAFYEYKTQIKLSLDDGKTAVINLPRGINEYLTDPQNSTPLYTGALEKIKAAYESDDGAHVKSADFITFETKYTYAGVGVTGA